MEGGSNRRADAACGACDQGGFTGEVKHGVFFLLFFR
jgi:hypothetical protein